MAEDVALLAATQVISQGLTSEEEKRRQAQQKLRDEREAAAWGPCACCVWVSKPTTPWCPSKAQFIGWCILAILSVISCINYLQEESEGTVLNWGYIFSALMAVVLPIYASLLFRNIYNLRKVLDLMRNQEKRVKENLEKIQVMPSTLKYPATRSAAG